ncbi:MAG TPA: ribosome recycling factor [Candidatus Dormibacteraeota bacterium]|nr:ribosome recycling factor [Candidatus Dormibacteraeota bacterium]
MSDDLLRDTQNRMAKSVEALQRELTSIRTGRASPALIEHLQVEVYDSHMPLNQVASISAPEAHMLMVQPWDRNNIAAIEKVLRRSDLGLNPANDGQLIRLPVPPLNEERRKEFVQMVKHRAEEARIAVRNIRRDDMEQLRGLEHEKEISMDEAQRAQAQLQKVTDAFIEEIEEVARRKEAELLEV